MSSMATRRWRDWVCTSAALSLLRVIGLVAAYIMPGNRLKIFLRPTDCGAISWRDNKRRCKQILVALMGGRDRLLTMAIMALM